MDTSNARLHSDEQNVHTEIKRQKTKSKTNSIAHRKRRSFIMLTAP